VFRIVLACLLFVQAPLVLADAEGEINYRKGVYRVVGGHMAALGAILRNGVYSDDLAYHANGMKEIARIAPTLFPEGSGEGKTSALPEIWEEPEAFQEAMERFVSAADGMAAAVAAGDKKQIGGAIRELGGSCKNCHDNFKAD
jgi:cytochrome c556